jgi:hypothetical protein
MRILLLVAMLFVSGRVFALGVDIGPVHVHGTKVKVGSSVEFKIVVDKVVQDDDQKDRVRRIKGHRVGSDEKFDIKVAWSDLDDDSKELLGKAKVDNSYKMKLEKSEDDWRLLKIRKD